MRSYTNEFDTSLMTNVLEHVQNAYQILQNICNSLRPGGILIFGERWWDQLYTNENYQTDTQHPIRIRYYVWKWFTDHFEKIYDARNHQSYLKYGNNGSYFIGRKRIDLTHWSKSVIYLIRLRFWRFHIFADVFSVE